MKEGFASGEGLPNPWEGPMEPGRNQPGQRVFRRGFVPTMGALHEGHLSLVRESARRSQQSVVSIFVNPTQFDRAEDLKRYPRTESADCAMLADTGCDAVWLPSVDEVYPHGPEVREHWDLAGLDARMEGSHRPGHFAGVAQVVVLMLRAVQPDLLLLGQKDFQQFRILQRVVEQAELPVTVASCPIVRESDGLAMSSRNRLLDPVARRQATALSVALFAARERGRSVSPQALVEGVRQELAKAEGITPEYAELVDVERLQPFADWPEADAVLCLAAWCGGVRLIDNVLLPA